MVEECCIQFDLIYMYARYGTFRHLIYNESCVFVIICNNFVRCPVPAQIMKHL